MSSISWFNDGKQFMSGHNNGSIIVWNAKGDTKPVSIIHPHSKQYVFFCITTINIFWLYYINKKKVNESDLIPRYNMIRKVCWESTKNGLVKKWIKFLRNFMFYKLWFKKNREPMIIFSDGLPTNDCPMKDAITIIKNNKLRTIIEMKEKIVDFIVVNSSPWTNGLFIL